MANNVLVNYNSASELRSFLEQNGLGMRKKFGQNFLINPTTRQALANALEADAGSEVWEIGPGLGAMTVLLLGRGLKVTAFEIDTGFIKLLKKFFTENESFSLIEGDVMKTWSAQEEAPYLLGNLPYNVAAAFLAGLIEKNRFFKRMVVTVQKETALRMTAKPKSKNYSSFSVLCSSAYRVKPLMTIHSSSFYPRPNVDSMGVLLEADIENVKTPKPPVFYPLVRALFSSRRKTIRNNMAAFIASIMKKNLIENENICEALFAENGLSGNERAEELDTEAFISLAESIKNMRI